MTSKEAQKNMFCPFRQDIGHRDCMGNRCMLWVFFYDTKEEWINAQKNPDIALGCCGIIKERS